MNFPVLTNVLKKIQRTIFIFIDLLLNFTKMTQYKLLEKYLQIETLSVVFVGEFNPLIFQPYWLAHKNLIREEEASNAKVEVIHNEIVRYEISDWLFFEITRNRCLFRTSKNPYFGPMKDLTCDIFKILKETPIKSVGLNCMYDLALQTEKNYYKFGSELTNLSLFGSSLNDPRLLQIEIREKERIGIEGASRRVRITPSDQLKNLTKGVSVSVNNHFEVPQTNSINSASLAIGFISDHWQSSIDESKQIIENLLEKFQLE